MGSKKKVSPAIRKFIESYEAWETVSKAALAKVAAHEPKLAKAITAYAKLAAEYDALELALGKAFSEIENRVEDIWEAIDTEDANEAVEAHQEVQA